METRSRRPSIYWPLLLLSAGIFLLLNTMGYFPGSTVELMLKLWPLLFIVGGIDSIYRGENFVGPSVFIGAGAIFLLANLGYIDNSAWRMLLQFWPVLLIAFGLDLLIGHRSALGAILGVLIGFAIIGGIVWFAGRTSQGGFAVSTEQVTQPLKGDVSAEISLEPKAGVLSLRGSAKSGSLVDGQARLANSETLVQEFSSENGHARYAAKSEGLFYYLPFTGQTGATGWDLKLSGSPTIDLNTQMITGEQKIDLTGLNVDAIDTETVIGQTILTLPAGKRVEGKASVIIGALVLRVPRGAAVEILTDTGLAGISVGPEFERDGKWIRSREGNGSAGTYKLTAEVPLGSLRVETLP